MANEVGTAQPVPQENIRRRPRLDWDDVPHLSREETLAYRAALNPRQGSWAPHDGPDYYADQADRCMRDAERHAMDGNYVDAGHTLREALEMRHRAERLGGRYYDELRGRSGAEHLQREWTALRHERERLEHAHQQLTDRLTEMANTQQPRFIVVGSDGQLPQWDDRHGATPLPRPRVHEASDNDRQIDLRQ